MATKNYMINDKWLDLNKQNIVELQSVDGVLDSLKVNGSEIETPSGKITITENGTDIDVAQYALADVNVEGGGGSSDFSTAEVSVVGDGTVDLYCNFIDTDTDRLGYAPTLGGGESVDIPIYKNGTMVYVEASGTVAISGSIVQTDPSYYLISGNCTFTIS